MTLYRFYKLDIHGRLEGIPEAVECHDDKDATAKAKERATNYGIEVWDLARRVIAVEPIEKR